MILHFHSKEADDTPFAEAICKSPDFQLQTHASIEDALRAYSADHAGGVASTVLIGISTRNDAVSFRDYSADVDFDPNRIHVIASTIDVDILDIVFSAKLLGNFIVRRLRDHFEAGDLYARIMRSCDPSVSGGVDLVMGSDQKLALDLVNQADKEAAENVVIAELERLGLGSRVAALVASALDEMLLSAKIDSSGESSTSGEGDFDGDSRVQVQLATSGEFVGINVVDYAGLLNRAAIFQYIGKSFRAQSLNDTDTEPVGLGISLIFKTGASVRFMCKQGQKTEVGLFFKRLNKIVEFRSQFQFVSTQFWR